MKKIVLFIVTALLISCKGEPDFKAIKKGMPLGQVIELVGEPKEKQEIPFPLQAKFYKYEKYVIVFVNDSVTRCEATEEMAKSMEEGLGDMSQDINKIDSAINEYKSKKPAN